MYGFIDVNREEKDNVLDLFEEQLDVFQVSIIPVMAWIILCRRAGIICHLNDIDLKKIFTINTGKVELIISQNTLLDGDFLPVEHGQCILKEIKIEETISEFEEAGGCKRYVRGKYLVWFFINFVFSVYDNAKKFFPTLKKMPKCHVTLGYSNAIEIIAPRANLPDSLRNFLKRTCVASILKENQSE